MKIKKIKNVKYTQSKNQEEIKWMEVLAKRNKLLLETDWTQLPDVKLSKKSRNEWSFWRDRVRNLRRISFNDVADFKKEVDNLSREKDFIYTEYSINETIKDVDIGKKNLHKLLISYYKDKMDSNFSPNFEEKYQETLDIITQYIADNGLSVTLSDNMNMDKLIAFIDSQENIDVNISSFPFFEITKNMKNLSIKEAILYILKQKKNNYNTHLQEEYHLIHYEHLIDSCVTIDDLLKAKREIEQHYGY